MLEEGSNVVEQMSNDEVNRQDANMLWIQISEPAKEFLTAFCLHLSRRHLRHLKLLASSTSLNITGTFQSPTHIGERPNSKE